MMTITLPKTTIDNERILRKALETPHILDFTSNSLYANFVCMADCSKCCGYAYFLPSEVEVLPEEVRTHLSLKNDKFSIATKSGRCIFYETNDEGWFCSIHELRPLRCRIYPYFPCIVDGKIMITLEPALRMLNDEEKIKKQCPGLGQAGKPLPKTISDCLLFLRKTDTAPAILATMIMDTARFNKIRNEKWFFEDLGIIPESAAPEISESMK